MLYQLVSIFDEHDKLPSQNLYTVSDCINRRNIEELGLSHHISATVVEILSCFFV